MEPNEQLAITLPALTEIVAGISASQLDDPTACENFSVQGVINHLLGGATAFAPAFRGTPPVDPASPLLDKSGSTAIGVSKEAFGDAMAELLSAINAPGAMERTIDAPFGQAPGSVVARFLAFDTLVHGWDLTSATNMPYDPPLELVMAADAFARQAVGAQLRDGDTFADEVEPPAGASRLEQLIAFSGRKI